MLGKSFAENINSTSVLVSGLKSNSERVQKRGLGSGFVPKLETALNDVKNLNNEQETLKAKLKSKTDELNKKMDNIKVMATGLI